MATAKIPRNTSRPASPTPSQPPPRAPGTPSVFSLASGFVPPPARPASHAVITRGDLERSQGAYGELLASAKAYRQALAALSTAASTLGAALEACARLKEARAEPVAAAAGSSATADPLLAAAGVHHLIANHGQILSETVYRAFEVPLLHDLDRWRAVIDDEEETYQARIRTQGREVRRLEKEGLKIHKQRRRDVARFRAHLVELTGQLDGLTALHADHAAALLRESQETSARIVDAGCSLVRAEVDIFESLARKGWSGGGLDDLLDKGQDLFAPDDDDGGGGGHRNASARGGGGGVRASAPAGGGSGSDGGAKLFSILPPKSILADPTPAPGHDSSLLVEATAERQPSSGDGESVLSADPGRPLRGPRPFSPQPIRRPATDVTLAAVGLVHDDDHDDDDDEVPGMTSSPQGSRDDEDALERASLRSDDDDDDDDSAHWEPLDGGEEVFHLRRRRTTQDSALNNGEKPRVLGEPSPESAWGSPAKDC